MGRCVSRKWIGIAVAEEFRGAELGQAFDVRAIAHEIAEAGEQVDQGFGAGGLVDVLLRRPETQLRDLAGAGADDGVKPGLVVDDHGFEMEAQGRIALEPVAHLLAGHQLHKLADIVSQAFHMLAHMVGREEPAQDDPEPRHGQQYGAGHHPGWFADGSSHKREPQRVEITRDDVPLSDGFANA